MLARILITLLLILIAVTTYTQTHHTIIYQPYAAHRLKNTDGSKSANTQNAYLWHFLGITVMVSERNDKPEALAEKNLWLS